jgi:hypothetical protein
MNKKQLETTVIKRGSVKSLPKNINWNRPKEGEAGGCQPSQKCTWAVVNGIYMAMAFLPNNDHFIESVALSTAVAVEEAMNGPYGMDGDVSVFYVPEAIIAAVVMD